MLRIYRSSLQKVMSLTFIGMVLGFLVDVLIAAKLGTGQTADALVIALTLPVVIDTAFRQGTRYSMVPLFMETRVSLGDEEFQRFVSGLLNVSVVLGVGVVVVMEALAPWIVAGLAPGLTAAGKVESTLLFRLCVPMIVFATGCTIMGVFLNSYKKFTSVALRNVLTPGVVLCVLLFSWGSENIAPLVATAHTLGFAGFFGSLLADLRHTGYKHKWTAWTTMGDLTRLRSATFLLTLGAIIRSGLHPLERLLASLVAVGGVSSHYFAYRLISALQALIGGSIATTALPGMTTHALQGDKVRLVTALRKNLQRALLLVLPCCVLMLVFPRSLISLAYGRGNFGETSIHVTAQIFFWLAFALLFWCLTPVILSGLFAQRAYKLVFRQMITVILINVVLAIVFVQLWGLVGLAIATALSAGYGSVNVAYLLKQTGVNLFERSGKERS
jgi:murein biosynthesis integral membrane protein MurJ